MNPNNLITIKLPVMIRRLSILTIVLFGFVAAICGQQKGTVVRGVVTDNEQIPLAGVIITENDKNYTITDTNGGYTITLINKDAVLTFSFLGMEKKEVKFNGTTPFNVIMEYDDLMLDDIIVIGYGAVKKSDLTGSVGVMNVDPIDEISVLSIEDALRGKLAGVHIGTNDGQPGESLQMRIRGVGSINASSRPLYVVDGVPMNEAEINPGDIESLEILKDASATAIYGSRGANGVVMITTKKGEKGKVKIKLTSKLSVERSVNLIGMMDSYEYNSYRNLQRRNIYPVGTTVPADKNSWDKYTDKYGNVWAFDPQNNFYADHMSGRYRQPGATNTDWQKLMMRSAFTTDNTLNISGGGDRNKYSVIGSFLNQEGIVIKSNFQRYGIRANFDQEVNNRLKMTLNIHANRSVQNGAVTNDADGTMVNMLAQQPVKAPNYTEDFEDLPGESALVNNNPWYQANYVVKDVTRDNYGLRLAIDHTIGSDFRINVSGSHSYRNQYNDQFWPAKVKQAQTVNGYVRNQKRVNYSNLNENLLYYNPKAWGNHKVDAMAGVTFEDSRERIETVRVDNIQYESLKELGINWGLNPVPPTIDVRPTRMMSTLARANYSYADKYLFTASMRADGSSRFGKNHKWGYFPSGAFAWRVNEEKFMKPIKAINNLKLRLSAGVSGNTAIPPFTTLNMLTVDNYPMDGVTPSLGAKVIQPANPDLKWESTTQYDAGMDIGLFKNRLMFTADVYYKRTRDLLILEPVSGSLGYNYRWSNLGEFENKGLELSLDAAIIRNASVKWNSSMNISFARSKVISLGGDKEMILNSSGAITDNFAILREGMPVGLWYGYQTDGLFRSYDEIAQLPSDYLQFAKTKAELQPGFQRYVDQNGDGKIDEGDRVVIGRSEPKFTGGWQNRVSWKDFQLNVETEFSYGQELFNATALLLERGVQTNNATSRYNNNYWHPTLYDSSGKVVFTGNEDSSWLPGTPRDAAYGETYAKDHYIEDGSYFRLSNVSLTYSIPPKFARKISMKTMKVTFSARNLWVWTKYSGYDPDVNSVSGDYADLIPGLDNGSYPRSRSYMVSLNFGF